MQITAAGDTVQEEPEEQPEVCVPDARKKNRVIVISSSQMGQGSEELGRTLLKAFIYALTQQDELPKTMLFYNSGVYMTC